MIDNFIGKRFGRLTVLYRINKYYWACLCSCGKNISVMKNNLKAKRTKSCGCLNKELVIERSYKHGDNCRGKTKRLYRIWIHMKTRCYSGKDRNSLRYRKKGIIVCPEWKDNYNAFKSWAILNGYQDDLTIDRKNNNGNYEPNNCQWLSRSENAKKYWRKDYAIT